MIAMIITFRKSNKISLEHQVYTYGSSRGGKKHPILHSPLLNISLPTGTDWIPHWTYTATKILTIIGHEFWVINTQLQTRNSKFHHQNYRSKQNILCSTKPQRRSMYFTVHARISYWAQMQGTALQNITITSFHIPPTIHK